MSKDATVEAHEMRSYRRFVSSVANSPEPLATGTPSEPFVTQYHFHAAVVVDYLFQKAERTVEILTKSFSNEIYGTEDIDLSVRDFLDRSASVRGGEPGIFILYEDDIDVELRTIVNSITNLGRHPSFRRSIVLMRVPEVVQQSYSFHFMTVDSKHYRFTGQRDQREALNQFNEPAFATELHKGFSKIWSESEEAGGSFSKKYFYPE